MVASYTVLASFLLSLCCGIVNLQRLADGVRNSLGVIFILFSTILFGVSFGYFREYDDQFNHFLFGFIYDDTIAILVTIWKEYHPILSFIGMGIILVPGIKIKRRFLAKGFVSENSLMQYNIPLLFKILITFFILFLFIVAVRGSVGTRPAQRSDAAVTKDEFLNKIILNPHVALRYAFKDQKC